MSKYIPISLFKSLYTSHSDLLTEEGFGLFKTNLISQGEDIAISNGFNTDDLAGFIANIEDPNNLVFYGWVEQNKSLFNVLRGERNPIVFSDGSRHLEHKFGAKYKHFLSPYLAEQLLRFSDETDMAKLSRVLSYCQILDEDHGAVVESQLFKSIKTRLVSMQGSMKSIEEEQELVDLVKPICTDDIIASVNNLSKASYALKLDYVDSVLSAIRVKSCTTRFANWILKQMEGVILNKEHEHKIVDLKRELREGELEVRNHGTGRTPIRWKNVVLTLFLLGVVAVVFIVINYKPFSDVKDQQFTNSSSFKEFTKEERIKMDSLLQLMNGNKREEEEYYDQGIPLIGQSSTLTLRKEFKNPIMERIYNDLAIDADNQATGYLDSCETGISYSRASDVKNMALKAGDVEAVIKNESDYDIIIYVAENNATGSVHSLFVGKGKTELFSLNKYNTFMIVAGNNYQFYKAPSNATKDELPSNKFKQHFCQTDDNYKESINTTYKVIDKSQDKVKFMVMGTNGSYLHVIDLNGVLESI